MDTRCDQSHARGLRDPTGEIAISAGETGDDS